MKLWPHQRRLIRELLKFGNIFSEKSREMGVSWSVMAFELHQALFTDYFTCLNLSRNEKEVQDTGCTYHSLMGRIHFMWNLLPSFLKLKVHSPFLTFHVLSTGSVIKGESANKNAGRDTQYKFIFIDEAAYIDTFDLIWGAVRNASDSIMVNSTPPDDVTDNKYVQLKEMSKGFTFMRFHWKDHPEKDKDWYKKKTSTMTQEEIDRELEISYTQRKSERSYAEWKEEIHLSRNKFYYNPRFPLILGFDFGLASEVILFLQQDLLKRLYLLHRYEKKNALTPEHFKNLLKIFAMLGYNKRISEIKAYGDPYSGRRRERTSGTSIIEEYRAISSGQLIIQSKHTPFDEKRRCVKALLKAKVNDRPKFIASSTCTQFSKCMSNVRMNRQGTDHVDNWATHTVNAFEYPVVHLYPIIKGESININIDENKPDGKMKINNNRRSINSVLDRHRITRRGLIR